MEAPARTPGDVVHVFFRMERSPSASECRFSATSGANLQGNYNRVVPYAPLAKTRFIAHVLGRLFYIYSLFLWPFLHFPVWKAIIFAVVSERKEEEGEKLHEGERGREGEREKEREREKEASSFPRNSNK